MRARGAKVTDVVILVVAADDGVMPQTREAIDHAKAAGVPIIVAVNKIDKPGANPEVPKRQLADLGLMPEDWGGDTVFVEVSAKQKKNLDTLLEMILLVTDIGEHKANPKRAAVGTVLETKLDRGRGPVATVLVQDGTLRVGDNVIAGPVVGRVRALIDDRGRNVKLAGPSTPVEMLGLEALPSPGDSFQAVDRSGEGAADCHLPPGAGQGEGARRQGQPSHARIAAAADERRRDEGTGASSSRPTCRARPKCWPTRSPSSPTRRPRSRSSTRRVGAINESDVLLATASNAIIIGFNVRPDRNAADVAEREKVDIRHHSVIYNVTEEIQKAMTGLLEPTIKEVRLGSASGARDLQGAQGGHHRRLHRQRRAASRAQGDAQARLLRDNVGRLGRASSRRSSASRTTCPR